MTSTADHGRPGGRRSLRTKLAVAAGLATRRASRLLGKGAGGMLGGRVAESIQPQIINELARGRRSVLITGTNGKSTTTKMTAAALESLGPVVANLGGDNMQSGVAVALMADPKARHGAFEVDEMNFPDIASRVRPAAMILLNLSRDQLDRVGEIGVVEQRLREAVDANPQATVVANCDDPLVVSAAWGAASVIWVAAGAPWKDDAAAFPRTGTLVIRDGEDWRVENHPEFRRPKPDWQIGDVGEDGTFTLSGPDNVDLTVRLGVPGRANRGNSAQAIAAAVTMGVRPATAARAVGTVNAVAGRYQTYDVSGRLANLLLAKNPAGWQESQTAIPSNSKQIVVAVNGQRADGTDLSWLWDIDFSALKAIEARVIASGERAADLAVRLAYSGVNAEVIDDPLHAILAFDPGPVQVLANYTAFRDLKRAIETREEGRKDA